MSLHHSSGQWRLGMALAFTTALLWGILPIALTVVLKVLDVYTVTWFRFLVSFVLLGIYLAAKRQLPSWKQLQSASTLLLAIATIFLAVNYLLYLQGLNQTSPTNSQVIIQLAPVMMGLGALSIFKERYTWSQWAGLGVLSLGMSLFFNDQLQALIDAPANYLMGTSLLVLAAATWAVYALAQKQLLQKLSSSTIMLIIYGGSALLFSPVTSPQQILDLNPLQWGMLCFCGLNTLLAYGAFAEALDHWEASRVSAVLSVTPIVTFFSVTVTASFFPAIVPPEQITGLGITGAILVVSGSLASALGRRQPKPSLEFQP